MVNNEFQGLPSYRPPARALSLPTANHGCTTSHHHSQRPLDLQNLPSSAHGLGGRQLSLPADALVVGGCKTWNAKDSALRKFGGFVMRLDAGGIESPLGDRVL